MWRWDIFCKVVDNYGDIGTCWRLAQQLANEYGADVRLWVDQLQSFARFCPTVLSDADVVASPVAGTPRAQPAKPADAAECHGTRSVPATCDVDRQRVGGIEICRWGADFPDVEAADVVIEAFACELPDRYAEAMVRRTVAPAWINLEYLSAEAWVEGCHRLASLRTKWPLTKYFFFPGFTPQTGGLLRERGLLDERAAFDAAAEAEFWRSVGVPARSERELRVSMFCYEDAALPELLRCWAEGDEAVTLLATPGPAADQTARWFGEAFSPGQPLRRASLTAWALPFLPQSSFDRLLWACDVNFVRGEDSFVRAQWAGQPFVWQIYPQAEEAHLVKLEAFLGRYLQGYDGANAVRGCWYAWNGRGNMASAWRDFAANRRAILRHGKVWVSILDQMGNLANNLVCFIRGICDLHGRK